MNNITVFGVEYDMFGVCIFFQCFCLVLTLKVHGSFFLTKNSRFCTSIC